MTLCLFVHMYVTVVRPSVHVETPPSLLQRMSHVAFGSDGQSGRGPDRVQPFPGSPGGNVTSSIKT